MTQIYADFSTQSACIRALSRLRPISRQTRKSQHTLIIFVVPGRVVCAGRHGRLSRPGTAFFHPAGIHASEAVLFQVLPHDPAQDDCGIRAASSCFDCGVKCVALRSSGSDHLSSQYAPASPSARHAAAVMANMGWMPIAAAIAPLKAGPANMPMAYTD
jgi:hypothetical protein